MTRAQVKEYTLDSLYFLSISGGAALMWSGFALFLPGLAVVCTAVALNRDRARKLPNPWRVGCPKGRRLLFAEWGAALAALVLGPWLIVAAHPALRAAGILVLAAGLVNEWTAHRCHHDARCPTGPGNEPSQQPPTTRR